MVSAKQEQHSKSGKVFLFVFVAVIIAYIVAIDSLTVFGAPDKKTDSLLRIIDKGTDKDKIAALNLLSGSLLDSNPKDALVYIQRSLKISEQLNDLKGKTEAMYSLGRCFSILNQYPQAFSAHERSFRLAEGRSDYEYQVLNLIQMAEVRFIDLKFDTAEIMLNLAEKTALNHNYAAALSAIYNNKAKISDSKGLQLEAIDLYTKAARIFLKNNNERDLAIVYDNIGSVNMSLKNYQQAIYYFQQAEKLSLKVNQVMTLANIYNNLGVLYSELDSLTVSVYYYNKALKIDRQSGGALNMAKDYLNLAIVFSDKSDFHSATAFFDSSLVLCQKYNLAYGVLLNRINRGSMYAKMGNHAKAIATMLPLIPELDSYSLPKEKAELYRMLFVSYKKSGQFEKALNFQEQYRELNDSITGVQKNKAILELQARYEKVKKEKEISELQESMLRQKNNTRLSIIGLLIFIIVLTVAGFTLFFQRRKAVYDKRLTSEKNELLGLKIELKDKELVNKSMHLANASQTTGNLATMIQDRLTTADKDTQAVLLDILKDIEPTSPQSSWKEFDIRFEQVYEGFYKNLFSKHPDLTPAEIRLCSFMRLNMSSKDIAVLTSRSIRTIENTRNNIRRKMNLGNNINLTTYLISL